MWPLVMMSVMTGLYVVPLAAPTLHLYVDGGLGQRAVRQVVFEVPADTPVDDDIDAVVRRLGTSGAICRVYGHRWETPFYSSVNSTPAVYHSDGTCPVFNIPEWRVCAVCGRREVKELPQWKESK